ncbi:MAG: hypothetical protein ABWX68_05420 [Arthrobacter sp.]|uniref:hypothetical protein n=1 Tax=Arthrobacter sp. TaxID=1667 RepID=UPI003498590B
MGPGRLADAGGKNPRGAYPRHAPGTVLAGWGLVVLTLCAAFTAIGLGGSGSSGVLAWSMFDGIGMVAYGVYRAVRACGPADGGVPGQNGRS